MSGHATAHDGHRRRWWWRRHLSITCAASTVTLLMMLLVPTPPLVFSGSRFSFGTWSSSTAAPVNATAPASTSAWRRCGGGWRAAPPAAPPASPGYFRSTAAALHCRSATSYGRLSIITSFCLTISWR